MLKTLVLCTNEDRKCAAVGSSIYLKLKSTAAFTSTCNDYFVKATITHIGIAEETIVPVTERAYDPCTKAFVENTAYGTESQYCYTFTYDDSTLDPMGSVIVADDVEDFFCLDAQHEFLNSPKLDQSLLNGDIVYYHADCTFDIAKLVSADDNNVVYAGDDGGVYLDCAAVTGCFEGSLMTQWTAQADSGSNQQITHAKVLDFAGGTGIDTVASLNTITINADISEVAGNQLQIAGDGGLYVASTAAGGSDDMQVLVPNADSGGDLASGASKIQHTTVSGDPFNFYGGFSRIRHDAACAAVGIGTGKMVRSAVINAQGTLVLDAAPEHCTQAGGTVFSNDYDNTDITVAPLTRDHGPTPPLLIGNGATCRAMNGLWFANFVTAVSCQSNGVWENKGYMSVNEGAAALVMNDLHGLYPGLTGTTWGRMTAGVAGGAPGNTIILQASQQVVTVASSISSSTIAYASINVNYIGGTC